MTTQPIFDGVVPLTHWGLIRARGADAVKFLQGQLTNDVAQLNERQVRLAGFCSAKGRLQASFLVWRVGPDELLLACAASVLPATLKRLTMFVLRAQCKLSDASAELALYGVAGQSALALGGDARDWTHALHGATTVLRLPDVQGVPRRMVLVPVSETPDASPELPLDSWRLLEVQSGVPMIEAATVDRFVPQMLNFEVLGGIDFSKGCYPGQEVVARSHYRGTIKRRMFLFECDASASPGEEVFHDAEPGQPAGMVVNAAPRADGSGSTSLVEIKLAALDNGALHLGSVGGAALRLGTLPYAVPREAVLPD